MDVERFSGILIIAGFGMFIIGTLLSPPGLYQETDLDVRLRLVRDFRARWNTSQILSGVGILLPAVGFLLLGFRLKDNVSSWLIYGGMALFLLGAGFGLVYLYRFMIAPAGFWDGSNSSLLIQGTTLMTLAGGLLFGVVFLQNNFPTWLGALAVGYPLIAGAAFLLLAVPAFYVISLFYFITLVAGVVLVT